MLRSLLLLLLAVHVHAATPPNIIFVLADDLGYGEIGCFGQKLIATPNLDRLAAEGVKFTRFYAGSPVCAPSRSVLMTGRHTGHTPVRGNAGKQNPKAQDLGETVILPMLLKQGGYATALIGKWGLGTEGSPGAPNRKGFDTFYGYLDQGHAHNPYPPFLIRNRERVALKNGLVAGSGGVQADGAPVGNGIAETPVEFAPDLMATEAIQWVEANQDRPFFLYWSLITPHANNEGTKHGRGQEIPDLGTYADRPWPKPDQAHAATITRLDADLGRMLAKLKELGLDEKTLVIFASDNGHHREGGNDPLLFDANGPLRGMKRDLYEGGIRTPTIARWPGHTPAGKTESRVCWFADLLPTFVELAGGTIPADVDGISLAPLLNGQAMPEKARTLYWEFHEGGFSQAVLMDGRWKAIRKKQVTAPVELYDVDADTAEEHDVAASQPELIERAKKLFESERTDSPDWPIKPPGNPGGARKNAPSAAPAPATPAPTAP